MTGLMDLQFPAFLWQEGYCYLALTPIELCAHPRSMFRQTVQTARSKAVHLLDASGRQFKVNDWVKVRPFGGARMLGYLLLGSVFARPTLASECQLTLPEFKEKLASAVRSRYRFDTDKGAEAEIVSRLDDATSFRSALNALRL